MKTGKVVKGSVLDMQPKTFTRLLKNYDPYLYIRWNYLKNNGLGMWEVRRRPHEKVPVRVAEYQGVGISILMELELDVINHVIDAPVLNYKILKRIREMDQWENKTSFDDLSYKAKLQREEMKRKNKEELLYQLKHLGADRLMHQAMRDGYNFLKHMKVKIDY